MTYSTDFSPSVLRKKFPSRCNQEEDYHHLRSIRHWLLLVMGEPKSEGNSNAYGDVVLGLHQIN